MPKCGGRSIEHAALYHSPVFDTSTVALYTTALPRRMAGWQRTTSIGAVCMRTALFTDVGIYEACNNKVRYYRKSVMRRVYLGE